MEEIVVTPDFDTDTDKDSVENVTVTSTDSMAICRICSVACKSIKEHMFKFHNEKKQYQCEECGLRFVSTVNLDNHVKKYNHNSSDLTPEEQRIGYKEQRYRNLKRKYSELVTKIVDLEKQLLSSQLILFNFMNVVIPILIILDKNEELLAATVERNDIKKILKGLTSI